MLLRFRRPHEIRHRRIHLRHDRLRCALDVVEGEIVDPEAVSGAIRELWRQAGIRTKDVCIGVSNQKVVVRLIDLPYMERAELAGAMQYVPGFFA